MSVLSEHMIETKRYYVIIITCLVVVTLYYVFFSKTENDGNAINFLSKTPAQKPLILENGIQEEIPTLNNDNVPLSFKVSNTTSNVDKLNTENITPALATEPEFSAEEQRIHLDKLNLAQSLAKQGKWQEFLALNDDLSSADAESLRHALVLAIMNDAPIDLIESLLKQGAVLDFAILRVLISKQSLSLIKTFVDLGLDVHMTNNQEENVINYAVDFGDSTDIIDYLISNGVDVMPNSLDEDALGKEINQCLNNQDSDHYALSDTSIHQESDCAK